MQPTTTRRLTMLAAIATLVLAAGCQPPPTNVAKPAAQTAAAAAPAIPYGANKAAGATFVHDGVTLYYETYGDGPPLLLVHGNGGSIGDFAHQIEAFKAHHRVIAMDSRDQGRSGDSTTPLTYERMTDDLSALITHLNLTKVDVVGWSDGGIEALLMGVRHPDQVNKLVAMAANLKPEGVYPGVQPMVKDMLAAITPEQRKTPEGARLQGRLHHADRAAHRPGPAGQGAGADPGAFQRPRPDPAQPHGGDL